MQLMRRRETWDPFREIEELTSRMNRFFGLTHVPEDGKRELISTADWTPSCNISETEVEYRIHAELPNISREDVHVTLEENVLTIQGDREEEKEEKGVRYHRRELAYGHFLRQFTMPDDADASKVDATFKDGILNVVIGKTKVKSGKSREIAIH